MSSSDGPGSERKTATGRTAAGKTAPRKTPSGKAAANVASGSRADDNGGRDPWFTPEHKAAADGEQADWFLPTGRAGLLPEAMTESGGDSRGTRRDRVPTKPKGAPPWGSDSAPLRDEGPPPWETGPWPGPGEDAAPRRAARAYPRQVASPVTTDQQPGLASLRPPLWLLLAVGAVALVVVAVVVVVDINVSSDGSGGCATYPAAVRQAYATAMGDLNRHAKATVEITDLGRASSMASDAAASASQIKARTALLTMAADLDAARATKSASPTKALPAQMLQQLRADGTALPKSC
ncbi:MAG: hypothetical protein J2P29_13685 [Actinobacteria bacterium]|nr:hypothetical protein [Actinomycetota bacterium]